MLIFQVIQKASCTWLLEGTRCTRLIVEPERLHAEADALLNECCFEDMRHVGQCKWVLLSSFSTVSGSEGVLAKHCNICLLPDSAVIAFNLLQTAVCMMQGNFHMQCSAACASSTGNHDLHQAALF